MVAMRIARDVEDAFDETVVRGKSDRQSMNQSCGTEGNGPIRRDGALTASSARGSTIGGGDNRGRMVQNLPYPEFLKRREEGRSFRCGGLFAPGHRYSEKSLLVLLLAEDEEDDVEERRDQNPKSMELSACSAEGLTPPKTMKMIGQIGERRVVVLR